MSDEAATTEAPAADPASFDEKIRNLGEEIMKLTLLEAKSLGDYLEQVHGIKPAGGGVMVAGPMPGAGGADAPAEEEKTEFDVVLADAGAKKINVIKVVRSATGLGLKEAKDLVESAPKAVKEAISKEDAEKLKTELEEAGAKVEIK